MDGRVVFHEWPRPPYALAWEIEQRDGLSPTRAAPFSIRCPPLSSATKATSPFFLGSWPYGRLPCVPPIVSFTGLIVGTGHSLLRRDLLPGLPPFQVFVIFPIRANPWAILCKKMAERRDSQFQPNVPFTCTAKVAGLLRHDVMLYPPGSDRDNVFIVVPDSWTFLDKAAAAVTPMTPLYTTEAAGVLPSAAFQDMRAASLSLATLAPSRSALHLWLRLRPRPAPRGDVALSLPIRRRNDRGCCIRPRCLRLP
ncbi:uncharacterized protein HRG_08782 [Hirsutella rhossiliensis]|uniref:Uncharacterized protein n=1 Tax=Hirsutella rhossiliensis TaxID=111463 RepID=A0A9P8SEK2_9HYPO|nr:uncharacterized protein HRG_08782 [Hirsutella rhossiliensis]KAH0959761.1 hypothetical protein HRG_08782 [Hirsutella rhossiliensis]